MIDDVMKCASEIMFCQYLSTLLFDFVQPA